MNAGQLGYVFGSFAMSLLFAVVWLLICKAIPPLRRRVGLSYGVAIALAFVPAIVSIGAPTNLLSIIGSVLCAALLFWQMKRAQAKQRAASAPVGNV